MKNEQIIAAWDGILPDAAAEARMRANIIAYQRAYSRKARGTAMKKYIPAAACLIAALAVTALFGFRHNWFHAKRYAVLLENGQTLVYEKGISKGEAMYAYEYDVKSRALTAEELQILLPTMDFSVESQFPHAIFKADTGEMLRLETVCGEIHIYLAQSGLPVTDVIVTGTQSTADIGGIAVRTGYFMTKPNSKGIRTAIFFAEFEQNNTTVYLETAGNEQESAQISERLSDTVYSMIFSNAADLSAVRYE